MRKVIVPLLLTTIIGLVLAGAIALGRANETADIRAELSVIKALSSGVDDGFTRVVDARKFSFPEDYGPHPDYGVEWWYYTGNLETEGGRHFGFELTFFRIGLDSDPDARRSSWGASQLYMAHLALTDVSSDKFYFFERFSRGALELAGAEASPFRVWLDDWSVESTGPEALPFRLAASEEAVAIDLVLNSAKPIVLQGDRGLSQKSSGVGNASYYYSMTRMPTEGTVRIGGESFRVTGDSWMDREWSTSALSDEQVGWDWFALQLSDGREVMYYQMRLRDGGIGPFSSGTLVSEDGAARRIGPEDVRISVEERWQSPLGGSPYPSRWRFRIPSEGLDVEITPYIQGQELDVSVRYWEGAVHVRGTSAGAPVSGDGYVEMTGYASPSAKAIPYKGMALAAP
ncbi:MAG: carotenoid 1,2-hydratase [Chloroflexi bacterium]|nr:carotenoid 1,2-hydratase [Chloroflexota bacterium]